MKLELKHLAPYLPYDLKILHSVKEINTMKAITDICIHTELGHTLNFYRFIEFKPILRPLSDLLKTIEVNNQKFMPARKLGFYQTDVDFIFINQIVLIQFRFVQKLIEWHFDIFGLIEKGLAVDINNL